MQTSVNSTQPLNLPQRSSLVSVLRGKVFRYRSKLKQHSVVHREQLICIYCNKVFKSEVPFNKHVETCCDIETGVPSSFVNVIKQVSCVNKPFNESTEIEAELHSEPEKNESAIASSSFTDIDFDNLHAESCSTGIHQPEPPESEVSTVYPLDPVTPPHIRQSRTAKKVSRKSMKVDSILANVEKNEGKNFEEVDGH